MNNNIRCSFISTSKQQPIKTLPLVSKLVEHRQQLAPQKQLWQAIVCKLGACFEIIHHFG